jgi:hypothetical protein
MQSDDKKEAGRRTTIRLPRIPKQEEARIAKVLVAIANQLQVHPDELNLELRRGKTKGKAEIMVSIPPELEAKAIERFGIKVFSPDKSSITVGGAEINLEFQDHHSVGDSPEPTKTSLRLWSDKEIEKKSMPKLSGKPDSNSR